MLETYLDQEEIVEKLRECIAIRSVKGEPKPGKPYGEEVNQALEYMLKLAQDMGFVTGNVDGHAGYAEYGQGKEMIAVLGHLDIVPEGEGWSYPPFEGQIADGKLYGRGATDDKGPMIGALFAMKAFKDAGIKLKRRIRVIFGTDEESGSHDMVCYREKEELPVMAFTPDADYPVIFSEKRLVNIRLRKALNEQNDWKLRMAQGGSVVNQVPDRAHMIFEKDGQQIKLESRGIAAHGSTPELGRNGIDALMKEFPQHWIHAHVCQELKDFAAFYLNHLCDRADGSGFDAAYTSEELGSSTFNVGLLHSDGEEIAITIDCRFPASLDVEESLSKIAASAERASIQMEITKNKPGLYIPKDHQLVRTLQAVYEKETGKPCKPLAIGGGTYAKTMPDTVAFGPIFPGRQNRIHEADEFITVDELMLNIRIMIRAMYELAGGETA